MDNLKTIKCVQNSHEEQEALDQPDAIGATTAGNMLMDEIPFEWPEVIMIDGEYYYATIDYTKPQEDPHVVNIIYRPFEQDPTDEDDM